jgi:hypothetical protein
MEHMKEGIAKYKAENPGAGHKEAFNKVRFLSPSVHFFACLSLRDTHWTRVAQRVAFLPFQVIIGPSIIEPR